MHIVSDSNKAEKEYKKTNTCVYSCQYHVIFTTKYRRKLLDEQITERLKELINDGQEKGGYTVVEMEITPDHVHLLLDVNPLIGIHKCVCGIKGTTSHILREEFPALQHRVPTLWTRSKFISSVGVISLEVVKNYIESQKKR